MALIQTAFIWVAYGIAVAIGALIAAIFTYSFQTTRDRSAIVSTVVIFTLTALLATILLLPVDVALVSSTNRSSLGAKKDWATPEEVGSILYTLRVVYYALYSLDALLCLVVVPFTYFWYEEYDEVDAEEGENTTGSPVWGALKYTLIFVVLLVIIFFVGFFLPPLVSSGGEGHRSHLDLDYFRRLLTENRGERALTFALGLLISAGIILYVIYTGAGLALMPIGFIKSAPAVSAPQLSETTASSLEHNRERQRQLEARSAGRTDGLPPKERRELEGLVREERTLVRRERIAREAQGEGKSAIVRAWLKICLVFRPLKLIGGILLLIISLIIWSSMLITSIDKAKNSICGRHCGYILGGMNIFQPMNWLFRKTSTVFPVDYILMAFLVLIFFSSSVVGIATIGIRFLWLRVFGIRKGRTSPQALLMATVMLALISLATNYAITIIVAPQYAMYGPQTFCSRPMRYPDTHPDCSERPDLILKCTELPPTRGGIFNICTPSVASTFLNRISLNFPFFGAFDFWAQFAFLGVFMVVFLLALFRTPKLNLNELDEDAEADEEEGLLASTGRRFGANWQDITGRSGAANRGRRQDDEE